MPQQAWSVAEAAHVAVLSVFALSASGIYLVSASALYTLSSMSAVLVLASHAAEAVAAVVQFVAAMASAAVIMSMTTLCSMSRGGGTSVEQK